MRIEQAATRKQAKIDNKDFIIVGVNKFKLDEEEIMNFLEIDNQEVKKRLVQNKNHNILGV